MTCCFSSQFGESGVCMYSHTHTCWGNHGFVFPLALLNVFRNEDLLKDRGFDSVIEHLSSIQKPQNLTDLQKCLIFICLHIFSLLPPLPNRYVEHSVGACEIFLNQAIIFLKVWIPSPIPSLEVANTAYLACPNSLSLS